MTHFGDALSYWLNCVATASPIATFQQCYLFKGHKCRFRGGKANLGFRDLTHLKMGFGISCHLKLGFEISSNLKSGFKILNFNVGFQKIDFKFKYSTKFNFLVSGFDTFLNCDLGIAGAARKSPRFSSHV